MAATTKTMAAATLSAKTCPRLYQAVTMGAKVPVSAIDWLAQNEILTDTFSVSLARALRVV